MDEYKLYNVQIDGRKDGASLYVFEIGPWTLIVNGKGWVILNKEGKAIKEGEARRYQGAKEVCEEAFYEMISP